MNELFNSDTASGIVTFRDVAHPPAALKVVPGTLWVQCRRRYVRFTSPTSKLTLEFAGFLQSPDVFSVVQFDHPLSGAQNRLTQLQHAVFCEHRDNFREEFTVNMGLLN